MGLGGLMACLLVGCADRDHRVAVSVPDQRLLLFKKGELIGDFPVSTSKFGLGSLPGSHRTPTGEFVIKQKIGQGQPVGAVFKSRRATGEVLEVDAPGRDPIVTRILWLNGVEPENRNTFSRYIYIHGTPEERTIGTPSSYGCVRMRSQDVITLFSIVGIGARVNIADLPAASLQAWGRGESD